MPVSLEIKKWPDRLLRYPSLPIPPSLIGTREIQDLIDSMIGYVDGNRDKIWGLAANQVGSPHKTAVIDLGNHLQEIINPQYVHVSNKTLMSFEGCLSFPLPGYFGFPVRRRYAVAVEALDRFGEGVILSASGWRSAWLQHEIDHLNGITIIDWRKRTKFLKEIQGSRLENPVVA